MAGVPSQVGKLPEVSVVFGLILHNEMLLGGCDKKTGCMLVFSCLLSLVEEGCTIRVSIS